MTIAAGFRCSNGVVLCADTQMSYGIAKFGQSKFRFYSKLAGQPAFVYAGDRDFSLMAIQMLAETVSRATKNNQNIIEAIQAKAIEIHERYFGLSTHDRVFELQALVTLQIGKQRRLFLINGATVSPVDRAECIGAGSYLGYYVVAAMFSAAASVWETAHVAAYLLFLAKSYVAYCGNESQILVFEDGKGWYPFPNDPMQSISIIEMESDFKTLQSRLSNVLVGLVNFQAKKGEYETALKDFSRLAGEIHTKRSAQISEYIKHYMEWQEESWEDAQANETEGNGEQC